MSEPSRRLRKRAFQRANYYRAMALTACWGGISAGVISILIASQGEWTTFLKGNVVMSLLLAMVALVVAHVIWKKQAALLVDEPAVSPGLEVTDLDIDEMLDKDREALIRYAFDNDIPAEKA